MTGIELAGLLKDYGSVGLNAILIVCVVKLYKDNQGLHSLMFERLAKALAAIEASTTAIVESRGTSQALGNAVEGLGKALNELSHENEKHDQDVRHGLNNAAFALTGLAEKLREIGSKIDTIRDFVRPASDRTRRP